MFIELFAFSEKFFVFICVLIEDLQRVVAEEFI